MTVTFPILLIAMDSPAWAQPGASAADIPKRARHDIAAMSWEPERNAVVPGNTLQSGLQERLDRRFAEADAAAPLKWYEPARIDEIATPGHAAARRYRVTTALG